MSKISIYFFALALFICLPAHGDEQIGNEIIYRAAFGSAQDVRLLLDRGANPQTVNSIGQPLIAIAAARNDAEGPKIVKALLDSGVDVNTSTKGQPLILIATKSGAAETLRTLLEYAPILEVKDQNGNSLIASAEARGDKKIIGIIKKAVAEEEARNKEGRSADNFKKLIREYTYLTCANQYLSYYVASGQNPNIDIIAFGRIIGENDAKIAANGKEIKDFFKKTGSELGVISKKTKQAISSELDSIGEVQDRVAAGVGTDADLKRRCKRIAEAWSLAKFKKK